MTKPETPEEMKSRLELMAERDSDWDLSDNDKAAIRWALNAMENVPAIPSQPAPPDLRERVIDAISEEVHGLQGEAEIAADRILALVGTGGRDGAEAAPPVDPRFVEKLKVQRRELLDEVKQARKERDDARASRAKGPKRPGFTEWDADGEPLSWFSKSHYRIIRYDAKPAPAVPGPKGVEAEVEEADELTAFRAWQKTIIAGPAMSIKDAMWEGWMARATRSVAPKGVREDGDGPEKDLWGRVWVPGGQGWPGMWKNSEPLPKTVGEASPLTEPDPYPVQEGDYVRKVKPDDYGEMLILACKELLRRTGNIESQRVRYWWQATQPPERAKPSLSPAKGPLPDCIHGIPFFDPCDACVESSKGPLGGGAEAPPEGLTGGDRG